MLQTASIMDAQPSVEIPKAEKPAQTAQKRKNNDADVSFEGTFADDLRQREKKKPERTDAANQLASAESPALHRALAGGDNANGKAGKGKADIKNGVLAKALNARVGAGKNAVKNATPGKEGALQRSKTGFSTAPLGLPAESKAADKNSAGKAAPPSRSSVANPTGMAVAKANNASLVGGVLGPDNAASRAGPSLPDPAAAALNDKRGITPAKSGAAEPAKLQLPADLVAPPTESPVIKGAGKQTSRAKSKHSNSVSAAVQAASRRLSADDLATGDPISKNMPDAGAGLAIPKSDAAAALQASLSTGANPPLAASPALLKSLAVQIATPLKAGDRRIAEVSLDPAELGKVRLTLHRTDSGIQIQVVADRPNTVDLMRRNSDFLVAEFRDLGYQDVGFSFSQSGQRQPDPAPAAPPHQDFDEGAPRDPLSRAGSEIYAASGITSGLDVRF